MSSPSMRQALSSRDTNLGGAGGVRHAVRPAATAIVKPVMTGITINWYHQEVEEAGAAMNIPWTTTLARVPALPMKLWAKQAYWPESCALRLSRMSVHVPERSAKMM